MALKVPIRHVTIHNKQHHNVVSRSPLFLLYLNFVLHSHEFHFHWLLKEKYFHYFLNTLRTLFEIFIFCPKIQLWFPEIIVDFFFGVKNSWKCFGFGLFSCWQLWFHEKNCQKKFGWKTRENVGVLDFLAVDNFDFTRKIVKKILGEKLVKMLGF